MGCCGSTPRSAQSSRHPSRPASQPGTPSSPVSPTAAVLQLRQNGSSQQPPNAPLRRPKNWRSSSRVWTRRSLAREREAFFDTRVTGRTECWAATRLATDMARNEGDLKGAQAVLDAAGLTVPTGRLSDGVWDERGVLYKLPRWVVSDPLNVADSPDDEGDGEPDVEEADLDEDEVKDVGTDDEDDAAKRDEKGKGKVVPEADLLRIRARLSDRGTDVLLTVEKSATIRMIARKTMEEANISSTTKVRIAYMGKMLRENETLTAQGWQHGHVLNVLVFQ